MMTELTWARAQNRPFVGFILTVVHHITHVGLRDALARTTSKLKGRARRSVSCK